MQGGIHHPAKVKRVIQLFMNGGASPMDTFDPKSRLAELDGQTFDPGGDEKVESVTGSPGFKLLKSPLRLQATWRVRALGQQCFSAGGWRCR